MHISNIFDGHSSKYFFGEFHAANFYTLLAKAQLSVRYEQIQKRMNENNKHNIFLICFIN